jgi:hypothetical protein
MTDSGFYLKRSNKNKVLLTGYGIPAMNADAFIGTVIISCISKRRAGKQFLSLSLPMLMQRRQRQRIQPVRDACHTMKKVPTGEGMPG